MRVGIGNLSLGRRIVGIIALGLAAILLFSALVALWTIREATESAYSERVTFALTLASRVDDVLRYAVDSLEQEAPDLAVEAGGRISAAQVRRLLDLRTRVGNFAIISVVDAAGRLMWTTPMGSAETIGDPLTHPGLQAVLQGGDARVSEFAPASVEDKLLACVSVPIRDAQGRLVGAVMAEIDPGQPALDLLPAGEVGSGVYAQLIGADGRVLAGTRPFNPETSVEHSILLADLIANRTPGYRIHDDSSEVPFSPHVVAYAPLSELPSWGVAVEESNDAVLALPRLLEQRLLLFGVVALLVAAAAAWVAARGAVQPLRRLTAAAERFAAGQLDEPVPLERADEIGSLARAFDMMRRQLRASLAEVADWNRTALLDPDRVIALVLQKARDLVGTELSGVALAGDRTSGLVWHLRDGDVDRCRRLREGDGEGIIAQVIRTGLPLRATDLEIPTSETAPHSPLLHTEKLRGVLAVPLFGGGQPFGVLMVANRSATAFSDDQATLLSSLANQAAVALENARLYQNVQSQAVLEERERIAREMHDGLAQVLGYVNTKALAVARLLEVGKVEDARVQVGDLESMARGLYGDIRESILGLRTTPRPERRFCEALLDYLTGFQQQSGIAVELKALGTGEELRLPFATEIQLLRIVQEALANVRKHSGACRAEVCIEPVDGTVRLVIQDDGRGFDPDRQDRGGWPQFGLKTMRERAESIHGTFAVESQPGAGARVVVAVPRDREVEVEHAANARAAGR